jgi:hypothetical protein
MKMPRETQYNSHFLSPMVVPEWHCHVTTTWADITEQSIPRLRHPVTSLVACDQPLREQFIFGRINFRHHDLQLDAHLSATRSARSRPPR